MGYASRTNDEETRVGYVSRTNNGSGRVLYASLPGPMCIDCPMSGSNRSSDTNDGASVNIKSLQGNFCSRPGRDARHRVPPPDPGREPCHRTEGAEWDERDPSPDSQEDCVWDDGEGSGPTGKANYDTVPPPRAQRGCETVEIGPVYRCETIRCG